MGKVGRNDPCPCGSGTKYKRCCGANLKAVPTTGLETALPENPPILDRRALERGVADIARLLTEGGFSSAEEADTYLQEVLSTGVLPHRQPASPLEEAQDLMYDAWQATGAQRVQLARKALRISADCADAYVLLAEESARSPAKALELYAKGVAAGERGLGKKGFQEYTGYFWGVVETRPYMRARFGLAQCLWELERQWEAVEHYWEMLRLNPGDNQGVRYILLACLLELGDQAGMKELLDRYPDDAAASWVYGRALSSFQAEGDTRSSRAVLAKAKKTNPFVPAYLVGAKRLPGRLPEYVGFGDESEGISCTVEQMAAWRETPGALAWLERSLDRDREAAERATGGASEEHERTTVPRAMRPHFDALVSLIDEVCREHLNEEYAQLCRRLAAALCRKRPSPVTRGRLGSWACGIVYAIGSVNFLFDKSQTPHFSAGELCALFGVSPSTGAAKASEIRKAFRMSFWDAEWCLPSKLDENPLAWMISVNGFLMDARHATREVQEEALRLGLIPHLPDTHI